MFVFLLINFVFWFKFVFFFGKSNLDLEGDVFNLFYFIGYFVYGIFGDGIKIFSRFSFNFYLMYFF